MSIAIVTKIRVAKFRRRTDARGFYSMAPQAIDKRRCRARMKALIDCRICTRCKYAFISTQGVNNCSECYEEAQKGFRRYMLWPETMKCRVSRVRAWAEETGFFPNGERRSIKPKIAIPNLEQIKPQINETFALLQRRIAGEYVCFTMPRVVRLKPYLHLQPIPDLRRFNGKKA